jgi:hypothetical protein
VRQFTAHAAKQHERQFGWNTFRVLTVTTDDRRLRSIMEALRRLHVPHSLAPRCSFSLLAKGCAWPIRSPWTGTMEMVATFA